MSVEHREKSLVFGKIQIRDVRIFLDWWLVLSAAYHVESPSLHLGSGVSDLMLLVFASLEFDFRIGFFEINHRCTHF
jgi:hypothetical protein